MALYLGSTPVGAGRALYIGATKVWPLNSAWSPADTGALLMWVDATDGIADLSGSASLSAHVNAGATSPQEPFLTTEGGSPAIEFQGNDARGYIDCGADIYCEHLFAVARYHSAPPGLSCIVTTRNSNYPWSIRTNTVDAYRFPGGGVDANDWVYNDTGALRVNGAVGGTHGRARHVLAAKRGSASAASKFLRFIGASEYLQLRYFRGWVHEMIWTGALAAGDVERFEGYLAHKWGLAGSLPADHPYKDAPP